MTKISLSVLEEYWLLGQGGDIEWSGYWVGCIVTMLAKHCFKKSTMHEPSTNENTASCHMTVDACAFTTQRDVYFHLQNGRRKQSTLAARRFSSHLNNPTQHKMSIPKVRTKPSTHFLVCREGCSFISNVGAVALSSRFHGSKNCHSLSLRDFDCHLSPHKVSYE